MSDVVAIHYFWLLLLNVVVCWLDAVASRRSLLLLFIAVLSCCVGIVLNCCFIVGWESRYFCFSCCFCVVDFYCRLLLLIIGVGGGSCCWMLCSVAVLDAIASSCYWLLSLVAIDGFCCWLLLMFVIVCFCCWMLLLAQFLVFID
jgi:hypothetical protein